MKFSIEKTALSKALNIVSKGIMARGAIPIYSGIYVEASNDGLIIKTTDLEISIKTIVSANVESLGKTIVPGKLFLDIIKSLPNGAVTFEQNNNQANVLTTGAVFNLHTMSADDFPEFPATATEKTVSIESQMFSQAVNRVVKAVSKDETRAILNGVCLTVKPEETSFVATDSFRLSLYSIKTASQQSMNLIIPGAVIEEVSRLALENSDTLTIGEAKNQIIFSFGNTSFISRKIEGNYPDYNKIIPDTSLTSTKIKTKDFLEAIKRVSILAAEHTAIRIKIEDNVLTAFANTQDVGEATASLDCEQQGEAIEIGFNHQYILDGLSSVSAETCEFDTQTPGKPGVLKEADEKTSFIYLMMPVNLN
ncbi:MAG: DNA polymerase III subunit beta [Coriobacteriales bacterium]|jgi:DNA polymerase-3 subunit beta|nr:DNA polymerase III subunit beta [Coriobacteriales bacterium]